MADTLDWTEIPGLGVQAPLSVSGDYVISHRPDQFTLSYRPVCQHVPLGEFGTLELAKGAAQQHADFVIVDCLGDARRASYIYADGSYNCPRCMAAVETGSSAWLARKCPNPACFARHSPPFPVDVARDMMAKIEARKKEEADRADLREWHRQRGEEQRREREAKEAAIREKATRRGACVRCALESARYGREPKYTKHRGNCPKETRR